MTRLTRQQLCAELGIPFHDVTVFGRIKCNVHVKCVGRDTAQKWAQVLAKVSSSKMIDAIAKERKLALPE